MNTTTHSPLRRLGAPTPVAIRTAAGDVDVVVTAAVATTVGEVLDRVGQKTGEPTINGRPVRRKERWRALHLGPGTTIGVGDAGRAGVASQRSHDVVELRQIAGLAAGGVVPLAPGTYRAGEVLASAPALHYGTAPDSAVGVVVDADGLGWFVDAEGRRSTSPTQVGSAAFVTSPIDRERSASRADDQGTDRPAGSTHVARPPRRRDAPLDDLVALPESTVAVPAAPEFSWAMVLAPLPIGLIMALLFRPIFALFALMGPIAVLGRYIEGRRRRRKMMQRSRHERDRIVAELEPVIDGLSAVRAQRLRSEHPSVDVLARSARTRGPRLWERRRDHDDFLVVPVGYVDRQWQPRFQPEPTGPIGEILGRRAVESTVPAIVDLTVDRAIGVVGPRFEALAVARAIVLSIATLHGPADVGFRLSCESPFRRDWDWVKWLPHVLASPDRRSLVHDAASLRSIERGDGVFEVLIVDDSRLSEGDDPIWRENAEAEGRVQIVLADRVASLPAHCSVVLDLGAPGNALLWPRTGEQIAPLLPGGVTEPFARDWAQSLAPLVDPDRSTEQGLPAQVRLVELLDPDLSPDAVADRWRSAPANLRVAVGVGQNGPVTIDLVADGPHALIAGTTGSGKSELLRSLIVSMAASAAPDHLSFVLIDFKGGEAFDACADLPHVGAVVTDLDEHLAGRALQSLNAELRRREQLLRASASVGIEAHNTAAASPEGTSAPPLARLVVVIDEFATLATELPDFLDALIDVAQRGRSLGVHLVLATQRPSGVLDNKIRANTNIRIALRVQATHDSTDILGSDEAASIDRRLPGRAWIRLGADDIEPFQAASVSLTATTGADSALRVEPFDLLSSPAAAVGGATGPAAAAGSADITTLVRSLVAANARFDRELPSPPWLPPLASTLTLDTVAAAALAPPHVADPVSPVVALGVADSPASQEQFAWTWQPAGGPLLVVSSQPTDGCDVSTTIAAALHRYQTPETCHLYILSGSNSGLEALAELPLVGAVIEGGDIDRVERLLALVEEAPADDVQRFLGIDDYGAVADSLTGLGRLDLLDRLGRVLSSSASGGPWSIWVTARNERAVPNRLLVHCPTRLIGKLADRTAYAVLGISRRVVPDFPPLRFIDVALDLEVQVASVGDGPGAVGAMPNSDDPHAGVGLGTSTVTVPPPVPPLPTAVTASDLAARGAAASVSGTVIHVPVGLAAADLAPAFVQFAPDQHLLVVGDRGSGRTSLLRQIASTLDALGPPVSILDLSPRSPLAGEGDPAERLGALLSATDNDQTPAGARHLVVLVDDADALPAEIAAQLQQLVSMPAADRPRLTIIAAAPADFLRRRTVWTAGLSWSGRGVLLSPSPNDGDVLNVSVGRHGPATAGRGFVVEDRTMRDVLFALPPPRASDPSA